MGQQPIKLPPGFQLVEGDASEGLPPGFEQQLELEPSQMQFPTGSATLAAARGAPGAVRAGARVAANHPAAAQRVIGGVGTLAASGLLGGLGASAADLTGGLGGVYAAGKLRSFITPTQAGIRRVAGRLMGESKDVAAEAGRAVGLQEYIKNQSGVKPNPIDIVQRPGGGLPAAEAYADSQGKKLLKLYGPSGEVVSGPGAVVTAGPKAQPSMLARGASAMGRLLTTLQGPVAMTDFAQTIEPNRRDIGFMGIGEPTTTPTPDVLTQIDTENKRAANERQLQQAQQWQEIRRAILARLGM